MDGEGKKDEPQAAPADQVSNLEKSENPPFFKTKGDLIHVRRNKRTLVRPR